MSGDIITVNVGKEELMKKFLVHASVVCKRSKFFEKAIGGDWKEAQDKSVDLSEDDPTIFSLYVQLLYKGTIPTKRPGGGSKDKFWLEEYAVLARLYILAEMLMDTATKNTVLDAILSKRRETATDGLRYVPSIACVKIIYEGTSPQSPARRLMVNSWTEITNGSVAITSSTEDIPKDFLYDLSVSLLDHRPAPTTGIKTCSCDASFYHEGEGEFVDK